jgi:hypothetical protein
VAFIEELQRRLTPQDGKPLFMSQSTPNLAHQTTHAEAEAEAALGPEHQTPFELRALEVALDVVSPCLAVFVPCAPGLSRAFAGTVMFKSLTQCPSMTVHLWCFLL